MQEAQLILGSIVFILGGVLAFLIFYLWRLKNQLNNSAEQVKALNAKEQQITNELTKYKNKFSEEILRDAVTGLPSLSVFKDQVQLVLRQSQRYQTIFGILFIDLRNFRIINNTLGYAVGDVLLKEVAERLQSAVRQMDVVCRFSGDIFVVLLSKLNHPESATLVVQRFFQKLAEPFHVGRHTLVIPASIGISIYPVHGKDVESLLKNASHALSLAKTAGAQQYQFYHRDLHDQGQREFLLNAALSREELFKELVLEYQPQMDLSDNSVLCWEVLLRWQHPDLGVVPAREFIQLAENNGRIEMIGEWVLQQVCRLLRSWQLQGYLLPTIAINISLRQLESPHFISMLLRIFQETRIDPHLLIFEVPETDLLKRSELSEKVFAILTQWGIKIAVDHFGAGDLLLRYLKKLPVASLKISRNFVRDLGSSKECEAIVNMMIVLAHSLNKQIIALGVETEIQKQVLQRLGCQLMQGHHFSLPLNEKELLKKLEFSKEGSVQEEDLTVS